MKKSMSIVAVLMVTANTFAQTHEHEHGKQAAHAQGSYQAPGTVNEHNQHSATEFAAAEQLQIAVQKICPVTGEQLGTMGSPIRVQVGSQFVYLCCEGCKGKEFKTGYWQSIQSNIAAAQGVCPIMGKPVKPSMKSTIVDGRQVFVCCPPCIAKIQADVEGTLKKVDESYTVYIATERQAANDRIQIETQEICPVSGQKLGLVGEPFKVKTDNDEVVFLCCKNCVGKQIKAEHWQTIQSNIAVAQGTCPVGGDPVDSSMKSTVINGRRIFVCCQSCIEVIKADPVKFNAKVDAQIAKNSGDKKHDARDGQNQGSDK